MLENHVGVGRDGEGEPVNSAPLVYPTCIIINKFYHIFHVQMVTLKTNEMQWNENSKNEMKTLKTNEIIKFW